MNGPTVVRTVTFARQARGRKRLKDKAPEPVVVHGERIPRATQLLALAITFEDMIRNGQARDYADIARRTGVSRARICQITRMLELPPEVQEAVLLRDEGLATSDDEDGASACPQVSRTA